MGERVDARIETNLYVPEQVERLVRYGERLATGMLPVVEPGQSRQPLPEPVFRRSSSWQEHQLEMSLTGLLVGRLDVSLLEGSGVSQLFLNLNYLFPRTYLIASRTPPRLMPIRITGRSFFIDDRQRVGAIAHVREVYEHDSDNPIPLWALSAMLRHHENSWQIVRCRRPPDAVGAFQRAVSRDALSGIQTVYDEVASEYGFVNFRQFRWQQFKSTVI